MKIIQLSDLQTVMSNPCSKHNYFGWPTVTRLQNGTIAVVASGLRVRHICPFGKALMVTSDDEGKTYSTPSIVIDTPLDDRDGGILPFGESGVIVTSFNNSTNFQRSRKTATAYDIAYLDTVTAEEEEKNLGSTFRISHDRGKTFGPIYKSPITSPHGPMELPDGRIMWIGKAFNANDSTAAEAGLIRSYIINPDNGEMEFVGEIERVELNGVIPHLCEPHSIVLDDGTILVHIRAEGSTSDGERIFTTYQSKSFDGGKTFTKPVRILEPQGGAPAHLFKHSSGMLICTYGYRVTPFGIKAMFSKDNGETWDTGYDIYVNHISDDIGYPSTIELYDGTLLTVFYSADGEDLPCQIRQTKWKIEL